MTIVTDTSLLDGLAAIVGEDGVLTQRADLAGYERGWRYGQGRARAVVKPRNTEQLAEVVRSARAHGVPVHPIGANTGLVGASNPDATGSQLVVSFERMNSSIEVDPVDGSVLVDAGVTLSQLNGALAGHGLFFPIDLGADPQVGGMIATNCGGARLVRYGDVRANLLGIEYVRHDGEVVSQLSRLRKDNTGLDLKQLHVGTSGALGFVTRAVLRVAHQPEQTSTALVAAADGDVILRLLARLESVVGEQLTAFEVLSRDALEAVLRRGAGVRAPFTEVPAYAALVELTTTLEPRHLDLDLALVDALEAFVESPQADGIEDVLLGRGEDFWHIRHQVSESLTQEGQVLALDLSVPRSSLAAFSERARALVEDWHPFVRCCDFGHWGDGGTHFNLVWDPAASDVPSTVLKESLQDLLVDLCVREFGGSFSAEHGVGPHNQRYVSRYSHPETRRVSGLLREHREG